MLNDDTEVLESEPGRLLRLKARGWPQAPTPRCSSRSSPRRRHDGRDEEDVVSGPGRLLPNPLRSESIRWRNVETLRRLAFLAENRAG